MNDTQIIAEGNEVNPFGIQLEEPMSMEVVGKSLQLKPLGTVFDAARQATRSG